MDEPGITKCIRNMESKRSADADGVPSFIVKGCAQLVTPVLLHIFNLSLHSGLNALLLFRSIKQGILALQHFKHLSPPLLFCDFAKAF